MELYENRLSTFYSRTAWPHEAHIATPELLAAAGFFYKPTFTGSDNVVCYLCDKEVDGWSSGAHPYTVHTRNSPLCPWVLVKCLARNEYGLVVEPELSMVRDAVTKIEYNYSERDDVEMGLPPRSKIMETARLKTFGDWWPHEGKRGWLVKASKLAKAGFYYAPSKDAEDTAVCGFCHLGLDHWEPRDSPINEHRNRRPNCAFFYNPKKAATKTAPSTTTRSTRTSTRRSSAASTALGEEVSVIIDAETVHETLSEQDHNVISEPERNGSGVADDAVRKSELEHSTPAKRGRPKKLPTASTKPATRTLKDEAISEPERDGMGINSDDHDAVLLKSEPTPAKRGRPKKLPDSSSKAATQNINEASNAISEPGCKGTVFHDGEQEIITPARRGRARKLPDASRQTAAQVSKDEASNAISEPEREGTGFFDAEQELTTPARRGRAKKSPDSSRQTAEEVPNDEAPKKSETKSSTPGKRGRPRKTKVEISKTKSEHEREETGLADDAQRSLEQESTATSAKRGRSKITLTSSKATDAPVPRDQESNAAVETDQSDDDAKSSRKRIRSGHANAAPIKKRAASTKAKQKITALLDETNSPQRKSSRNTKPASKIEPDSIDSNNVSGQDIPLAKQNANPRTTTRTGRTTRSNKTQFDLSNNQEGQRIQITSEHGDELDKRDAEEKKSETRQSGEGTPETAQVSNVTEPMESSGTICIDLNEMNSCTEPPVETSRNESPGLLPVVTPDGDTTGSLEPVEDEPVVGPVRKVARGLKCKVEATKKSRTTKNKADGVQELIPLTTTTSSSQSEGMHQVEEEVMESEEMDVVTTMDVFEPLQDENSPSTSSHIEETPVEQVAVESAETDVVNTSHVSKGETTPSPQNQERQEFKRVVTTKSEETNIATIFESGHVPQDENALPTSMARQSIGTPERRGDFRQERDDSPMRKSDPSSTGNLPIQSIGPREENAAVTEMKEDVSTTVIKNVPQTPSNPLQQQYTPESEEESESDDEDEEELDEDEDEKENSRPALSDRELCALYGVSVSELDLSVEEYMKSLFRAQVDLVQSEGEKMIEKMLEEAERTFGSRVTRAEEKLGKYTSVLI